MEWCFNRARRNDLVGGSGSNQYLTGIDKEALRHRTGGTGGDEGTDVVYFKEINQAIHYQHLAPLVAAWWRDIFESHDQSSETPFLPTLRDLPEQTLAPLQRIAGPHRLQPQHQSTSTNSWSNPSAVTRSDPSTNSGSIRRTH